MRDGYISVLFPNLGVTTSSEESRDKLGLVRVLSTFAKLPRQWLQTHSRSVCMHCWDRRTIADNCGNLKLAAAFHPWRARESVRRRPESRVSRCAGVCCTTKDDRLYSHRRGRVEQRARVSGRVEKVDEKVRAANRNSRPATSFFRAKR